MGIRQAALDRSSFRQIPATRQNQRHRTTELLCLVGHCRHSPTPAPSIRRSRDFHSNSRIVLKCRRPKSPAHVIPRRLHWIELVRIQCVHHREDWLLQTLVARHLQ